LIKNLKILINEKSSALGIKNEKDELIETSLELFNGLVPRMTLSDLVEFSSTVVKTRVKRGHFILETLGNALERQKLNELKPLQVLELAQNTARVRIESEKFWNRLEESLLVHFFKEFSFGPKGFTRFYWAFRLCQKGSDQLFEVIRKGIFENKEFFSVQSVKELAEALLEEEGPDQLMVNVLVEKMKEFQMNFKSRLELKPDDVAFFIALLAKVRWNGKELDTTEKLMLENLPKCEVQDLSRICHMYGVFFPDYLKEKTARQEFLCEIETFIARNPEKIIKKDMFGLVFKLFWGLSKKKQFPCEPLWNFFLNFYSKEILASKTPVVDDFLKTMKNQGFKII
jgi:hypothetical protein